MALRAELLDSEVLCHVTLFTLSVPPHPLLLPPPQLNCSALLVLLTQIPVICRYNKDGRMNECANVS